MRFGCSLVTAKAGFPTHEGTVHDAIVERLPPPSPPLLLLLLLLTQQASPALRGPTHHDTRVSHTSTYTFAFQHSSRENSQLSKNGAAVAKW